MGRYRLSRFQIPLQSRVLNELHLTHIGESFAADRFSDKAFFQREIQSGQILNRVSVLRTG